MEGLIEHSLMQPLQNELSERLIQSRCFFDDHLLPFMTRTATDVGAEWEQRLSELETEFDQPITLPVALLGTTGAGKSTLINSIIHATILPSGAEGKACTGALTVVRRGSDDSFVAKIEFLTRQEWDEELLAIRDSFKAAQNSGSIGSEAASETEIGFAAWAQLAKDSRDKIRAVYGIGDLKGAVSPTSALGGLGSTRSGTSNQSFIAGTPEIDFNSLQLPPELESRLCEGAEPLVLQEKDPRGLRLKLKQYITDAGPYWPLVRKVTVSGPFQNLPLGVELIDLPGLDDPNEARERVTRDYLAKAPSIWLVSECSRGIKNSIRKVLIEQKLLRQFLFDGKVDALTVIGTKVDGLNLEEVAENLELTSETSDQEVRRAWRAKTTGNILHDLGDMSIDLVKLHDGEDHRLDLKHLAQVQSVLSSTPVFLVASHEYKTFWMPSSNETARHDTGFPDLIEHLQHLSETSGTSSRLLSIESRLTDLMREVVSFFRGHRAGLVRRQNENAEHLDRLRARLDAPRQELLTELQRAHTRVEEGFLTRQRGFEDRLDLASRRASRQVSQCIARWGMMHHMTLKATLARNGRFLSSSGVSYDFNEDLADPLRDGIAYVWNDFFGDFVKERLEQWRSDALAALDGYRKHLQGVAEQSGIFDEETMNRLPQDFEVAKTSLTHQFEHALTRISGLVADRRRFLSESIELTIRKAMLPAYISGRSESGTGMKQRMIAHLSLTANAQANTIFLEIESDLRDGINDLRAQLITRLKELERYVDAQANRVRSNLSLDDMPNDLDDAKMNLIEIEGMWRANEHCLQSSFAGQ